MNPNGQTRSQAYKYRKARLSVIPISADGTKSPNASLLPGGKWEQFASKLPTKTHLDQMFPADRPVGIGIVGGVVSGVEVIDVDDAATWQAFKKLVDPELLAKVPQVRTPRKGGGRHLYLFNDDPGRNCKLARDAAGKTLIEVRGQAGYVVSPGSHPDCHSNGSYKHVAGPSITDRPTITTEEKAALFAAAVSLDLYIEPDRNGSAPTESTGDKNSPGNIFMRRETFETAGLLEKHGWKQLGIYGDRMAWARPGKGTPGFSALSGTDQQGHDRLVVFSSNGGKLEEGRSYNLFHAFAALECKSNFGRAALKLAAKGYKKGAAGPQLGSPCDQPLAWQPFPLEVLPEPLASYIAQASTSITVDPAFFAGPSLAQLAGAVGNSRVIQLKDDWREPAVIWAVFLATSGMQKSPTMDFAFRHLREQQEAAFVAYSQATEIFNQESEQYEDAVRTWKSSKKKCDRPQKPQQPVCRRSITDDITIEALVERLAQNPRGVVSVNDELAGWVLSMNQYRGGKGADVQYWLKMHGARSVTYDRKGQEPIYVPRAAVSVAGPMPPSVFRSVMEQQLFDNGLVPRLLLTMPPEAPKKWGTARISHKTDQRMRSLIRKLTELEMDCSRGGMPTPIIVDMNDEARALFGKWYDHNGQRQAEAEPLLKAAYSKIEAYCGRISLLLHLIRFVTGKAEEVVDRDSVQRAITVCEWFARESERVYTVMLADQDTTELLDLVAWVRGKGGETTVSELTQSGPRKYRRLDDDATEALNRLVDDGLAETGVSGTGKPGRPKQFYRLVDYEYANSSGNRTFVVHSPPGSPESEDPGNDEIEVLI